MKGPTPSAALYTHASSPSSPCSSLAPGVGAPALSPCPCPSPSPATLTSFDPQRLARATLTSCPCPTPAWVAPLAFAQAPQPRASCPWRPGEGRVPSWQGRAGGGEAGVLPPPLPDAAPSAKVSLTVRNVTQVRSSSNNHNNHNKREFIKRFLSLQALYNLSIHKNDIERHE